MRVLIHCTLLAALLGIAACDRPRDASVTPAPSSNTSEATPSSNAAVVLQDTAITAKVKAALATTDDLKDSGISVETIDGRVILTGKLPDEEQHKHAITVARAVEGVRDVESRIAVGKG